jgi:maleylpyruvate isomerase
VLGDPGAAPAAVAPSPGGSVPAQSAPVGETGTVAAPAAALVGWLTGRTSADILPGSPPDLPPWL